MTVVVGIHNPEIGTVIGSDRLAQWGERPFTTIEKTWRAKEWVIGHTGDLVVGQYVRNHGDFLVEHNSIGGVVLGLRTCAEKYGFLHPAKDDEPPTMGGNSFLVGHRTGLWMVGASFVVVPIPPMTPAAVGCGAELALGAAEVLMRLDYVRSQDAGRIVAQAVEVASKYSTACGGGCDLHLAPIIETAEKGDARV